MHKIEKYIYVIIAMILVAIISCTTTYFVVKSNNIEVKEKDNKNEEPNNKKENEIEKELDLKDTRVEKAYKIVSLNNDRMFDTGFYESKKMTYEELPYKQAFAYRYREPSIKEVKNYKSCDEIDKEYDDLGWKCIRSGYEGFLNEGFDIIDAKELEKTYKEIFGNNRAMAREDFYTNADKGCSTFDYGKKSDSFAHIQSGCGYDGGGIYTKLVKATLKGNEMALYDKHIVSSYGGGALYKDVDMKILLTNDPDPTDDIIEKGQAYKHVFEANGDGTYHWVSSEPVDSLN